MKIALMGYGKMGKEIEAIALALGETVAQKFDIDRPADVASLSGVDMCIEFSTPDTVVGNIQLAIEAQKDIVVGTTGWYDKIPEVRNALKKSGRSGLLYSANFSIGVNMYFRIVAAAAELMRNANEYDPYIHELHHRQKADSPSGTALHLAEILMNRIDRKREVMTHRIDGKIPFDALHVTSTRVGSLAGTHTVGFDSEWDLIELTHTARSRRGFALGALRAARWLKGRKGVYTMDDVEL
ncbi:MAG TPA: 4-hydroxy-tetrahydrodipicolinate reductase [Terriglobia bacterium]|nr:4-hydroxy-tetrahydrodipicolinate reductase [Terriglobia bacterium]